MPTDRDFALEVLDEVEAMSVPLASIAAKWDAGWRYPDYYPRAAGFNRVMAAASEFMKAFEEVQ